MITGKRVVVNVWDPTASIATLLCLIVPLTLAFASAATIHFVNGRPLFARLLTLALVLLALCALFLPRMALQDAVVDPLRSVTGVDWGCAVARSTEDPEQRPVGGISHCSSFLAWSLSFGGLRVTGLRNGCWVTCGRTRPGQYGPQVKVEILPQKLTWLIEPSTQV